MPCAQSNVCALHFEIAAVNVERPRLFIKYRQLGVIFMTELSVIPDRIFYTSEIIQPSNG